MTTSKSKDFNSEQLTYMTDGTGGKMFAVSKINNELMPPKKILQVGKKNRGETHIGKIQTKDLGSSEEKSKLLEAYEKMPFH